MYVYIVCILPSIRIPCNNRQAQPPRLTITLDLDLRPHLIDRLNETRMLTPWF
jgi:hypothetical protein